MGFLDKAKAAAEQGMAKAKETAGELQTKRELGQAYDELGQKAFELVESGAISSAELDPLVEKVRSLKKQLEEGEAVPVGATATTEPAASDAPPAMPS